MALKEQTSKSELDPYNKKDGTIPGLEYLADTYPDRYQLPSLLTKEQAMAIAEYAVVHTAQRITPFRSSTEVEGTVQKSNAEAKVRNAFNDFYQIVAAVKTAIEISREFITAAENHERQIEEIRQKEQPQSK